MILKALDPVREAGAAARAGARAERTLAHYLDRAFDDDPRLLLLHGLRLERDGDAAQIDHLLLHRAGFVIVESKSVTTAIALDARGEFRRAWDGGWRGMASPIEQARRQARFLAGWLAAEGVPAAKLAADMLVAISDGGTVARAPGADPQGLVLKADLVPARVRAILRRRAGWRARLAGTGRLDDRALNALGARLLAAHRPLEPSARLYRTDG